MKEIWKNIIDGAGIYQISNKGRLKSYNKFHYNKNKNKKFIIMKPSIDKYGYLKICINKKNYFIHRLVLEGFNGKTNLHANHIDGNKLNNNLVNLEWCTISENIKHALKNKLIIPKFGESHPCSKLKEYEVIEIRKLYKTGLLSQYTLAKIYNVSQANIEHIVNYKLWKHL